MRSLLAPLVVCGMLAPAFAQDALDDAEPFSWIGDSTRIDAENDSLTGDGIDIYRSRIAVDQSRGDWDFELAYAYSTYSLDYFDPTDLPSARQLSEDTHELSLTIGRRINDSLVISLGGSFYDGFSDYRSLWIGEYYRQNVGVLFLPQGYQEPDPKGVSTVLSAVWDYAPGSGRLTGSVGWASNDIAPVWSANPVTAFADPSEEELDSFVGTLAWEAAINGRMRNQLQLNFSQIDARRLRTQVRETVAWAATDKLTLRGEVGYTEERPTFQAYYGGLSLDYEFISGWHAGLSARLYRDTGEALAGSFNTAAPSVRTSEISASLLWQGLSSSLRLSVGLLDTEFGVIDVLNRPFGGLYADREQLATRIAFTHNF